MKRLVSAGAALLLAACSSKAPEPTAPRAVPAPPPPLAAASAPAPRLAPAPPPTVGALAYLDGMVGKYPEQSGLLASQPLANRLTALLGPDLPQLIENLQVRAPLQMEAGVYYLTGAKQQGGGTDAAALVIDPAQDVIYVVMLVSGARSEYVERGVKPPLPADVQKMLSNWH
jgi:hypothetical protein